MMRSIVVGALACATLLTAQAQAFDQQGSSAGPFVSVLDPTSAPTLLGGFWFDFTKDDHHLKTIAVMARTSPDRTILHFTDKNSDDPFTYFTRQVVTTGAVLERTASVATSENCERPGLCNVSIGDFRDYVFVLQGFYLSYEGTDHHMNRIAIFENKGILTIAFNDKNGDDFFGARVEYAWVPRSMIQSMGHAADRNESLGFFDVPKEGEFVVRGFDFDFVDEDHHLNMIGISRGNVAYADWNHDDAYDWGVDWAIMQPAKIGRGDVVAPGLPVFEKLAR
jgi:hypothetical protein